MTLRSLAGNAGLVFLAVLVNVGLFGEAAEQAPRTLAMPLASAAASLAIRRSPTDPAPWTLGAWVDGRIPQLRCST